MSIFYFFICLIDLLWLIGFYVLIDQHIKSTSPLCLQLIMNILFLTTLLFRMFYSFAIFKYFNSLRNLMFTTPLHHVSNSTMVPPFYNFDSGLKLQFIRAWPPSSEYVPNLMTSCASNVNVQTPLIIFNVFIISLENLPNHLTLIRSWSYLTHNLTHNVTCFWRSKWMKWMGRSQKNHMIIHICFHGWWLDQMAYSSLC